MRTGNCRRKGVLRHRLRHILVAVVAEVLGEEGRVFGDAGDFAKGLPLGFFLAVFLAVAVKYGASYDGDDENDAVLFLLCFAALDLFVGFGCSHRLLERGFTVWAPTVISLLLPYFGASPLL